VHLLICGWTFSNWSFKMPSFIKSSLIVLERKWHHRSYGAQRHGIQVEKFINFWHPYAAANIFVTTVNKKKIKRRMGMHTKPPATRWSSIPGYVCFTSLLLPIQRNFWPSFSTYPSYELRKPVMNINSFRNDKDIKVTNCGRRTSTRYRD